MKQNLRKLIKDIFLDLIYMKSKGKREERQGKKEAVQRGKGSVVKKAKKKNKENQQKSIKILQKVKKSKKQKNARTRECHKRRKVKRKV